MLITLELGSISFFIEFLFFLERLKDERGEYHTYEMHSLMTGSFLSSHGVVKLVNFDGVPVFQLCLRYGVHGDMKKRIGFIIETSHSCSLKTSAISN